MVIAIDGRDGAGKSPIARCLSWQLQMPAIETDLYIIPDTSPLEYRYDDLFRAVQSRLKNDRPVIVEGIFVLKNLEKIGVPSDFLILVETPSFDGSHGLKSELDRYFKDYAPEQKCNFRFQWDSESSGRELPFQCV